MNPAVTGSSPCFSQKLFRAFAKVDETERSFFRHCATFFLFFCLHITVHRQAILLLVVESGTRKFRCLSVECLFVESGTYDVICQFCTVRGMVVESEVLKAQSCALSKLSLPMHSNAKGHLQVFLILCSKLKCQNAQRVSPFKYFGTMRLFKILIFRFFKNCKIFCLQRVPLQFF